MQEKRVLTKQNETSIFSAIRFHINNKKNDFIILFTIHLIISKHKTIITTMYNPTILVSRMNDTVDSACVMHELRNLGVITRVEIVNCLTEDDVAYNMAIVHFKHWYKNASTEMPLSLLKQGNPIKLITTNKRDNWQAYEYTDRLFIKPTFQKDDCRPYSQRRMDDLLCDQDVAQGFNDRRKRARKDDMRTYRERRLDDALCEEDVAQGFIDRRIKMVDYMSLLIRGIAPGLPDVKEPKKEIVKPVVRNPEMVIRMQQWFRCEITDDIYRNNVQMVRDAMAFAKDLCDEEDEETQSRVHYDGVYPVMKRSRRIIL